MIVLMTHAFPLSDPAITSGVSMNDVGDVKAGQVAMIMKRARGVNQEAVAKNPGWDMRIARASFGDASSPAWKCG
jgi:hypothetical protein